MRLKTEEKSYILLEIVRRLSSRLYNRLYNTKMKVVKSFGVHEGFKYPYDSPCKRNFYLKVSKWSLQTLCLTIFPFYITNKYTVSV